MPTTSPLSSVDLLNSTTNSLRQPTTSPDGSSFTSRPFFTRGSSIADDETTFCPPIPDHISFASLDDLTVASGHHPCKTSLRSTKSPFPS
jgi:hypothetical protein